MTNGEPTTKDNLKVREFEEIVVRYPPEDICVYPEYKGKPYFSIKYKEGNNCIIGYGTYSPKVFSKYLRDYFMSSVTPQEQKTGHWIERKKIGFGEWKECIVPLKDGVVAGSCSCSECGEWLTGSDEYPCKGNFCPNCGVNMIESEDKE